MRCWREIEGREMQMLIYGSLHRSFYQIRVTFLDGREGWFRIFGSRLIGFVLGIMWIIQYLSFR
jgi:hypothetical protein